MAISRELVLTRRKRWEEQKRRNEEKLKALKEKIKLDSKKISQVSKREEVERQIILGKVVLEKMKTDVSIKELLESELQLKLTSSYEKSLFGLAS